MTNVPRLQEILCKNICKDRGKRVLADSWTL